MAIKQINENPSIADIILFDILAPNSALSGTAIVDEEPDCFLVDPFKVDTVKIFYIERSFTSPNIAEAPITTIAPSLQAQLDLAKKAACDSPTTDNLSEVGRIESEIKANSKVESIFFNEAKQVAQFGNEDFPAWLSTDVGNAMLTQVTEDEEGNTIYGHFQLEWNPLGMREGDYLICWTWTPLPAGDKFSAHSFFSLNGATQLTTSIPTHFTNPKKYEILQERYIPEMFKMVMCNGDLAPQVMRGLNNSVGDGFTFLEDLANQIVDLIDPNATHESLLPLLGNLFNLKLRSGDPTLWRRQIKNAIPYFKQKGTLNGLQKALSQAGIKLEKFTRLWQVVSPYTYQELFDIESSSDTVFELTNLAILPVDTDNFELYYRGADDSEWTILNSDYVSLVNSDGITVMTWVGDQLSVDPIILDEGDSIRVVYEIIEVPDPSEQAIEEVIRLLPLSDQRDERDQAYPLKNWNVRLIEEDDALFDVIISTRHPFSDAVIFGKIRTEFPYSENIYNMDEYNGSKRDSTSPCDIDRQFVDACKACQSSKFNVNLEIENISDDRIIEATQIIKEFTPFHAQLHSINLLGGMNDFVLSPIESIIALVYIAGQEMAVVDPPQMIFNRSMATNQLISRSALADVTTPVSGVAGTISNSEIVFFAPTTTLDQLGVEPDSSLTFLEILSPSANQGEFTISDPDKTFAVIASGSPVEPLDHSEFTFRLSNERIRKTTSTSITQDDVFIFDDANIDFDEVEVKTQWDVDNDPTYSGGAWSISIAAYAGTYSILQILPDGSILIEDDGSLPTSNASSVVYTIKNDSAVIVESSSTGSLTVKRRGLVDYSGGNILIKGNSVLASNVDDIRSTMDIGNYLLHSGTQYLISGFVPNETLQFYIKDWAGGDVSGVTTIVYKRLKNNGRGFLHYRGLVLDTSPTDQESALGILNGINAPVDPNAILEDDLFKENFLVYAGLPGSAATFKYYAIAEIDGTSITLAGPDGDFETTGTAVEYDILKYTKHTGTTVAPPDTMRYDPVASIQERTYPPTAGFDFEYIDRRGNEVISVNTETSISMMSVVSALNSPKDEMIDYISQKENISYLIEYKDNNDSK